MDSTNGLGGHLSIAQAAVLLGVSVRHVRRLIATGQLAGDTRPYRTHTDFVDAYRRRRQGLCGDVVDTADISPARNGHQEPDTMAVAFTAALAELGRAREQVAQLARENGRLEVEMEHGRQGQNGHRNGHRGSALARLGPWMRHG